MKILDNISRFLVGGLFIFSGLIKVNDPFGTAIKLEEYFVFFSTDFAAFFAYFEPFALQMSVIFSVLEVTLGVALLLKYRMNITVWVLLLLILFFTFLTFYSAYFDKVTDCGCFGDAIPLDPWQSFIKDVILLFFVIYLFIRRNKIKQSLKSVIGDVIMSLVVLINVFLAIYAIEHLPYIDFRPYKTGKNISSQMQPSEPFRYRYIMEKEGEEYEFDEYPTDTTYEFKDMVLLNPEAQPKITDYAVWDESGDFTQYTFEGYKLLVVLENVEEARTANMDEIRELLSGLGDEITPIILTSSGEEKVEAFRHEHQLALPYYYADETVLKAIIRANPGIVLLHEGTVLGKWHSNDTPEAEDIYELIRQ